MDEGVYADDDKMSVIQNAKFPKDAQGMQCFLSMVTYLAPYFPDVAKYTGLLSLLTHQNRSYDVTPMHETCFKKILFLATDYLVLKPINPKNGIPIFVIVDASTSRFSDIINEQPQDEQAIVEVDMEDSIVDQLIKLKDLPKKEKKECVLQVQFG
ncbi:hypothetical protein DACRYDRAFT_108105 [Dacryopinax primogenitus]|uniref:Reverse transcriptase/retrotransposon-derived protein RNase H-like domain-containing protein n=1 Tax=Dacryopinax primogenitus (strain DJM 731) TaxID=1858805 RepID=M5FYG4_DACPD|nr:uncharacterized protein DACRYDRAFT_108105 [Dacryopinax primogenitus]EJU01564.1 hypothetical protein DACRYDRAFT_108105 [Dacryopinax primogenitus]